MKKIICFCIALATLGFSQSGFALEESALPVSVSVVKAGNQEILADSHGLTAYVFDVDAPGTSKCYNACAKAWPAILVENGDQLAAPFGITTRTDGSKQVTFQNHPIYTYVGDGKTGDTNGNGLGGVWHIIPQPAASAQ